MALPWMLPPPYGGRLGNSASNSNNNGTTDFMSPVAAASDNLMRMRSATPDGFEMVSHDGASSCESAPMLPRAACNGPPMRFTGIADVLAGINGGNGVSHPHQHQLPHRRGASASTSVGGDRDCLAAAVSASQTHQHHDGAHRRGHHSSAPDPPGVSHRGQTTIVRTSMNKMVYVVVMIVVGATAFDMALVKSRPATSSSSSSSAADANDGAAHAGTASHHPRIPASASSMQTHVVMVIGLLAFCSILLASVQSVELRIDNMSNEVHYCLYRWVFPVVQRRFSVSAMRFITTREFSTSRTNHGNSNGPTRTAPARVIEIHVQEFKDSRNVSVNSGGGGSGHDCHASQPAATPLVLVPRVPMADAAATVRSWVGFLERLGAAVVIDETDPIWSVEKRVERVL